MCCERSNIKRRLSIASAGNDHRLGANEAPPAIMSIYMGDELNAVLKSIKTGKAFDAASNKKIEIGDARKIEFNFVATGLFKIEPNCVPGTSSCFFVMSSIVTGLDDPFKYPPSVGSILNVILALDDNTVILTVAEA